MEHKHGTRKQSKTAQALELVNGGTPIREAAARFGLTTQSIYRLRAYRKQRPICPVCGR